MRTTLAIDDEAMKQIRRYAQGRHLSLGAAASDLIRRGAQFRLDTKMVNGLPVFNVPADFPAIPVELVNELLDEQ